MFLKINLESFLKTVNFKEGPRLDKLEKQLNLVINQFLEEIAKSFYKGTAEINFIFYCIDFN